jgi:hypothetical protein
VGHYADEVHDTVNDEIICIAVFSDTGQSVAKKKAVEASIKRPIGIRVVSVGRVQEFPRERINVRVSQQRRITYRRSHFTSFAHPELSMY